MSELPKFRRIEDVKRFLEDMFKDLDATESLIKEQQRLLSNLLRPKEKLRAMLTAAVSFDVTPSPSKSSQLQTLKKKIDPALTQVVVPNIKKLQDQYSLMEDLYEKHTTLESAATQIEMQFPDRRGPAYEQTMAALADLRKKVETQLRDVFEFLSSVANKHVPQEFLEYVEAIAAKISDHVYFEESKSFIYVSVKDGELEGAKLKPKQDLVFTQYILLTDSVSDEGKIAPNLYVVVQWVVGGTVTVFLEHEFMPPNRLSGGTEVSTVQDAVASIAQLLDLEGFASYLGTLPMALQLKLAPEQLKPSLFSGRNYIDTILVSPEKLSFMFKHHAISEAIRKKVAYEIFPEVKALLKTKNSKLRMTMSKKSIDFYAPNLAQEGTLSTQDLTFLQERYGLSDQALRKISQIMNG
jgi:hypothetical protein